MKKLKVLEIVDAVGGEFDCYCKQLKIDIEEKHISETNRFLNDGNILIKI